MNRTIVALDVDNATEALSLVERLGDRSDFYKVGMELYAAAGLAIVRELQARGKRVFLDLKLYDIGETVKRATAYLCHETDPTFLTVHGSRPVMEAALEGRAQTSTKLLAVSVLTSFDADDLLDLGYPVLVSDLVDLRVRKAVESGLHGVVCSPLEVRRVREIAGPDLVLVTPGVRSEGASTGDQKRVATPREAVKNGASYIVIGRQVTRAADPESAFRRIQEEVDEL